MTHSRTTVSRGRRRAPFAAAVGALLLAAGPAAADRLVMADGTRVETRGPWAVKGKLVVFTSASGALASLRLAEVDLEASRAATAAASEAAAKAREEAAAEPEPPADRPKPVLVLTDADVGHVDPATLAARREAAVVASPKVVLFSTSWCGWCRKTRTLLAELGVGFEERDIEKSAAAGREFAARFGRGTGVPVLDVGGTVIRGFSEGKIRRAVDEIRKPAGGASSAPGSG